MRNTITCLIMILEKNMINISNWNNKEYQKENQNNIMIKKNIIIEYFEK